jgi:hypothetical protein
MDGRPLIVPKFFEGGCAWFPRASEASQSEREQKVVNVASDGMRLSKWLKQESACDGKGWNGVVSVLSYRVSDPSSYIVGAVGDDRPCKLCPLLLRLMKPPLFDLLTKGESEHMLNSGDSARIMRLDLGAFFF